MAYANFTNKLFDEIISDETYPANNILCVGGREDHLTCVHHCVICRFCGIWTFVIAIFFSP